LPLNSLRSCMPSYDGPSGMPWCRRMWWRVLWSRRDDVQLEDLQGNHVRPARRERAHQLVGAVLVSTKHVPPTLLTMKPLWTCTVMRGGQDGLPGVNRHVRAVPTVLEDEYVGKLRSRVRPRWLSKMPRWRAWSSRARRSRHSMAP
jgi:hypothetical protein